MTSFQIYNFRKVWQSSAYIPIYVLPPCLDLFTDFTRHVLSLLCAPHLLKISDRLLFSFENPNSVVFDKIETCWLNPGFVWSGR